MMQNEKFKSNALYIFLTLGLILQQTASALTFDQIRQGQTQEQVLGASTPALVQHAFSSAFKSSVNVSFPSGNAAGDLLVVTIRGGANGAPSVSDTAGNTYALASSHYDAGSTIFIAAYYAKNSRSGSNTVTAGLSGSSNTVVYISEFSGVDTISPLDQTATNNGFGGSNPSVNVNTTVAGDLVYGFLFIGNGSGAAGTGFNGIDSNAGFDINEYSIQASSGAVNALWNNSSPSNGAWHNMAVSFKAAGSGAPDTTPPVISAINSSAVTSSSATITWITDEVSDSQVEYGTITSYGSSSALNSTLTTSHSVKLSGLSASTLYHYRVKSSDSSGNLAVSADNTFTTSAVAGDTTAPSTPAGLSATAISSSAINLSWTASTDNVGVTGYKIFRNGSQINTTGSTSYSDSGLTASTNYTYTVSAYDAAGNTSAQSTTASATTQAVTTGSGTGWTDLGSNTVLSTAAAAPGLSPLVNCNGSTPPAYCTGATANYSFLGLVSYVEGAQSGAAIDTVHNCMYLTGGGHGDYFGNQIYNLCLVSGKWTMTRMTDPSALNTTGQVNPDGTAVTSHTQQGLVYLPNEDAVFKWGIGVGPAPLAQLYGWWITNPRTNPTWVPKAPLPNQKPFYVTSAAGVSGCTDGLQTGSFTNGGGTGATFTVMVSNGVPSGYLSLTAIGSGYTSLPTTGTVNTCTGNISVTGGYYSGGLLKSSNDSGEFCLLDTTSPTESVLCIAEATYQLFRYTPSLDTGIGSSPWTTLSGTNSTLVSAGATCAIDPVHKVMICPGVSLGYGPASGIYAISLAPGSNYASTNITTSTTGCDALYNVRDPGFEYDPTLGQFVGYTGTGNDVIQFNYATLTCTTQTIAGGPTSAANIWGLYKRFAYFPSLNQYLVANNAISDVFSLQLSALAPPVQDTTPPSVPTGITANASTTSITLSWTPSTDIDDTVASYRVYRNGAAVGSPTVATFMDTGLSPGTTYSYTISAIDSHGNVSTQSSATTVTTQQIVIPPPSGGSLNGLGGSTTTCLDQDADGYGIGPGCIGSDSDDTDAAIHAVADVVTKYGSINAFLVHLGYQSGSVPAVVACISTTGSNSTGATNTNADTACNSPFATFAGALPHLVSPYIVVYRGGTYNIGTNIITGLPAGTPSRQNYIMGYPGEKFTLNYSGGGAVIDLSGNTNYVTLDCMGGVLNAGNTGADGIIIGEYYAYHTLNMGITVRQCESLNYTKDGGVAGDNLSNVLVENNVFHDPTPAGMAHGIYLGSNSMASSNVVIRRNIVYNVNTGGYPGIQFNGRCISGCHIDQNMVYNADGQGIAILEGFSNGTISSNLVFNVGWAGAGGAKALTIFDYDGNCGQGVSEICPYDQTNNVISNNTFWIGTKSPVDGSAVPNSPAVEVMNGTTSASCGSLSQTAPCGNLGGNFYYNNIIIGAGPVNSAANSGYPAFVYGNTGGTTAATYLKNDTFANNILNTEDGSTYIFGVAAGSSYGFHPYNCAQIISMAKSFAGCSTAGPQFVNAATTNYNTPSSFNFHLTSTSPAISAGTLTGVPTYDIVGNTFNNPPSIGAYEYNSSGTPPPAVPTINSFTASVNPIIVGNSTTLSFSATNATSLSLDNGIGSVTGLTSKVVSPSVTTTYTLTATNSNGSVTSTVTVVVNNAPDTTAPTASITAPANNSTVSGTITVSATASDPTVSGQVTSGLNLVTVTVDGGAFATSTSGTLSKSLDTTTLTNSTHTISVIAKDNAGNVSSASSETVTVNNVAATKYPRLVTLTSLEGLAAIPAGTTITATVVSPSTGAVLETESNLTPTAGQYTVSFQASDPQLVNIRIQVSGYLSQLLTNIDTTVNSSLALSVPQLLAGDLNNDNTINSLDYSLMNSHFLQNFSSADINKDSLVNSLDFAILKNNYGKMGQ